MAESAPTPTAGNFSAVVASNVAAAAASSTAPAAPVAPTQSSTASTDSSITELGITPEQLTVPGQQADAAVDEVIKPEGQADDPWAEQVHGVSVKEIVEAIKKGELPDQLMNAIKRKLSVDGEVEELSLDEMSRQRMRHGAFTRRSMQLAKEKEGVEQTKQNLVNLFAGLEHPVAFGQIIDKNGLAANARAYVTRNWGNEQQPNVGGFMEDMRRLGHWATFQAAAQQYAQRYSDRLYRYTNGSQDAAVLAQAKQMVWEDERDEAAMWAERLRGEQTREEAQRLKAQLERHPLLAPAPQQQPALSQADVQHIATAKAQAMTKFGITGAENAERYFNDNVRAVIENARNSGAQLTIEQILHDAAAWTYDHLREEGWRPQAAVAAPAPQRQQAPAAPSLPARPTAAPTPVTISAQDRTNKTGGTIADFNAWTRKIQEHAGRR